MTLYQLPDIDTDVSTVNLPVHIASADSPIQNSLLRHCCYSCIIPIKQEYLQNVDFFYLLSKFPQKLLLKLVCNYCKRDNVQKTCILFEKFYGLD